MKTGIFETFWKFWNIEFFFLIFISYENLECFWNFRNLEFSLNFLNIEIFW